MPFGDLDSLEAEGWPLGPGDDNLPLFTKVTLAAEGEGAEASLPAVQEDDAAAEAAAETQEASLEVSRPELLELQAFELALTALAALADAGELARPGGAAAAPGGAAVRAGSYAARGAREDVLVTVELLPRGGGAPGAGSAAEEPGTYL
jgi:hypothetical protein